MDDLISRKEAIEVLAEMQGRCTTQAELIQNSKIWQQIKDLPSAQPDTCDGCVWEYTFGYGKCYRCKRAYNDMYEVKDDGRSDK